VVVSIKKYLMDKFKLDGCSYIVYAEKYFDNGKVEIATVGRFFRSQVSKDIKNLKDICRPEYGIKKIKYKVFKLDLKQISSGTVKCKKR